MEPQGLASPHNTWLFIGTSLAALFIMLLLVAFLSLCINKRKRTKMGMENRQQVFDEGTARDNMGYEAGPEKEKRQPEKGRRLSPTYINFKTEPSNQTLRSGIILSSRPDSSLSSSTTR